MVGDLTYAELDPWLSRNTQGMVWVNDGVVSYDGLDSVTIRYAWQDLVPVISRRSAPFVNI